MKKSTAKRKLVKLLKTWEGSQLNAKLAGEILDLLTSKDVGMVPPFSRQQDLGCECGCKGRCPRGNKWDSEGLPEGANQVKDIFYR